MDRSLPAFPVPEIIETNLNHSFKFNSIDANRKRRQHLKAPKLYPKELQLFKCGHREVQAVSFRENSSSVTTSTPVSKNSSLNLSSVYDKNRNESFFEQCFENIKKLGEGSFGEVFKVRSRDDGKYYAIKKMRFIHRGESYRRERLEEVRRYEEFSDNEHCVTLYKAWEQDDSLFMQFELCRGSVYDYVEEVQQVSESFVWSFLLDMLIALKSLHDKHLIHLDIKLDNILITDDYRCKLADFGLVFDIVNSNHSRAYEGDSHYLAPELMQGNYCLANDIFSLGITLLELACNLELPTNGKLWQELRSGILPESAMLSLSPELQKIIRSMMEPDPYKRPTVNDLLNHRILRKLLLKRRVKKFAVDVKNRFTNGIKFIRLYIVFFFFLIFNFFKLRDRRNASTSPVQNKIQINVQHYDEHSDDESFKTSVNISRVSKVSAVDDDNNNESNITPTLNNSIPKVTPELKIINSTPLNHFNHGHEGVSSRKFRRDLTKSCFEPDDAFCSPVIPRKSVNSRNSSQDRESLFCSKKLLFSDEDLDDF